MSDFTDWIDQQLSERGWSGNELARRAGLSSSGFSFVMTAQRNPGLDFCVGVARALGEPPEDVLRRAGLLPPVPPPVVEEREAVRILRQLSAPARGMALALLRALRGGAAGAPGGAIRPYDGALQEGAVGYGVEGIANREPRTASEWLAQRIAEGLAELSLEDQDRVFRLMQRLRGREGADAVRPYEAEVGEG